MKNKKRIEKDSFGSVEIPSDKYWGVQTQRSISNFSIGWENQPNSIIKALGIVKKACAISNRDCGKLEKNNAKAIIQASTEIIDGKLATEEELKIIEKKIDKEISESVKNAIEAPEPPSQELTKYIWAED